MSEKMSDFDKGKYDDDILDVEEVVGSDIKINPDYYIHNALLKAQQALCEGDLKDAFARYKVMVEHIEVLCRAAGMTGDDYEKNLAEFKETAEYKNEEVNYARSVKLSNKKIELLMGMVFNQKTSTDPMKG